MKKYSKLIVAAIVALIFIGTFVFLYEKSQPKPVEYSELTKGKYENGKANITEFNEAKNNLLKSQSDMVQAKYEYLYQNCLLDFYRGKELNF